MAWSTVVLVVILAGVCLGTPFPATSVAPFDLSTREASLPDQCTFAGNSDIYGLGIRVGIYLQWISGFVSNLFLADSVRDALAANTTFLAALFVALTIITANETVHAVEVVILLQFCFGFLFSVSSIWGLRVRARRVVKGQKRRIDFSPFGSTARILLAAAICAYSVWFWFVGLDQLDRNEALDPRCSPLGFLFAPIDLAGGAQVFLKIACITLTVFYGGAMIVEVLLFVLNWTIYTLVAWLFVVLVVNHNYSRKALGRTALRMSPLILGGIPWLIMNGRSRIGLKRLQSLLIVGVVLCFLGIFICILFSPLSYLLNNLPYVGRFLPHLLIDRSRKPVEKSKLADESKDANSYLSQNLTVAHGDTQGSQDNKPIQLSPSALQQPEQATATPLYTKMERNGNATASELAFNTILKSTHKHFSSAAINADHYPTDNARVWQKFKQIWKIAGNKSLSNVQFSAYLDKFLIFLPLFNFLCLVWSVVSIELTIRWNNITDVYAIESVGQLIPFVIGVVGIGKLLRDLLAWSTGNWVDQAVTATFADFTCNEQISETEPPLRPVASRGVHGQAVGLVHLPQFLNQLARNAQTAPMLRLSIGEQVATILRSDNEKSKREEGLSRKIAETRALEMFDKLKMIQGDGEEATRQRDALIRKLRALDIDSHVLAARWLEIYVGLWRLWIQEQWQRFLVEGLPSDD